MIHSNTFVCLGGLLLLLVLSRRAESQPQCTSKSQGEALMALYESSGGPNWISNAMWGTDENCLQALDLPQGRQELDLPPFCCWALVECCVLHNDIATYAPCKQHQCNCTVGTVTGLSLGHNGLRGQLQNILNDEALDALACSLRIIFLGGNALTGFVPHHISALNDLRILSLASNALTGTIPPQLATLTALEELDISNNLLTGSVPPQLCGGAEHYSRLRDLILSNNKLSGELALKDCDSLIYLDVQNNQLSGPLLELATYRQLHILRLGNNLFSGPVSVDSFDLRLLVVLDLSMNNFSGPLPSFVGNSSQLTIVRLFNNSFTGPLPPDIFTGGTLSSLQLYNNKLLGTLPENIGDARGATVLNLRGNELYGTLPSSLANIAPYMGMVDVSFTQMSCCGFEYVPGRGYMHFNLTKPRLPNFLMQSDVARPVVDTGASLTNMRCPFVVMQPQLTNDEFVTWGLDPEYYLYEGCECLRGYQEVWTPTPEREPSMGPTLSCVVASETWYAAHPWALVLVVLGSLLVATWLTFLMCFRRGKAAIAQGFFNMRKRIKGEPVGGQVSIVVTDIEGYSDLMKQSPILMTRALNLHNAIVRKSRWNNFGYTVEQEGDSFSLVFYEAYDAVTFCLQTQLALNRQTWPEGLFQQDARHAASRRRAPAQGVLNAISVVTQSLFGTRGGDTLAGLKSTSDGRPDSRQDSGTPAATATTDSTNNAAAVAPTYPSGSGSRPVAPVLSASRMSASYLLEPSPPTLSHTSPNKGHLTLFNGLRVRMGIATGTLPPGSSSKGSIVMDMVKMVSDMANGGQILMDETTFKRIKERMEEFGAVDHNGINYTKLNSIKPPWYSCLKRKQRNLNEALVLDMGEYTYCPGAKRLPLFQLDGAGGGGGGTGVDTPGGGLGVVPTPRGSAGSRKSSKALEPVRVYQISPPPLVARAKVFGNKVALKDEWFCSDLPYFAAPGTSQAPLDPLEDTLVLPAITMAFAIVEGGKTFVARYRRDARRVNDVAAACIRSCLQVVAQGYLCRLQDGDLKYMVAFASPEKAVEWALLLQDVLMYAEWPEAALKYWREEYDERGRLIFRGPRMKIGMCEGCPRSIIPDHIGRADYHGASINQAARYMDAAAHGGMVALEASLVLKVMNKWREVMATKESTAAANSTATMAAATAATTKEVPKDAIPTPLRAVRTCTAADPDTTKSTELALVKGSGAATPSAGPVAEGRQEEAASHVYSAAGGALPTIGNGKSNGASLAAASPLATSEVLYGEAIVELGPSTISTTAHVTGTTAVTLDPKMSTLTAPPLLQNGSSVSAIDGVYSPELRGMVSGSNNLLPRLVNVPCAKERSCDGRGAQLLQEVSEIASEGSPVAVATEAAAAIAATAAWQQQQQEQQRLLEGVQLAVGTGSGSGSVGGGGASPVPPSSRPRFGAGARIHVSFAATERPSPLGFSTTTAPYIDSAGIAPSTSPAAAMIPSHRVPCSDHSAAAPAVAAALSPSPSPSFCPRSPQPLSLPPLALPSNRERDALLRAERAAVEASRKVQLDSPSDTQYRVRVLSYRIGVFLFKGSSEAIHMAHVILEHLKGRHFPPDAPKGKGAKVGDSSGLVDDCDVELPDLAASLRDRYMLLNGLGVGPTLITRTDIGRSSPGAHRRLRSLLPSISLGGGGRSPRGSGAGGCGSGSQSPRRSSGGSALAKSRSIAAHRISAGGSSGVGGGQPVASESGMTGAEIGVRHSPSLISHLAYRASLSMRWAAGAVASRSGGRRDSGSVTEWQFEMSPPFSSAARRRSSGGSSSIAIAATIATEITQASRTGLFSVVLGNQPATIATTDASGNLTGLPVEHSPAASTENLAVAIAGVGSGAGSGHNSLVHGLGRMDGGSSDAAVVGGSGGGSADPRVARPSPLRNVHGRDDPPPERQLPVVTVESGPGPLKSLGSSLGPADSGGGGGGGGGGRTLNGEDRV